MAHPGREPYRNAGVASAEAGFVMLDGPDGVAISLTAEAAEMTGRNLIEAAQEARRQAPQPPADPA